MWKKNSELHDVGNLFIYFGSQSEKNTSPNTIESKKKTQQPHLFFSKFPSLDKVFMLWSYKTGHHIKQGTNLKKNFRNTTFLQNRKHGFIQILSFSQTIKTYVGNEWTDMMTKKFVVPRQFNIIQPLSQDKK